MCDADSDESDEQRLQAWRERIIASEARLDLLDEQIRRDIEILRRLEAQGPPRRSWFPWRIVWR